MMTPRAIKRKVNTFIEQKVLGSQQATAIMFEELCKFKQFNIQFIFT